MSASIPSSAASSLFNFSASLAPITFILRVSVGKKRAKTWSPEIVQLMRKKRSIFHR
jgi:hypothetical protein